MVPEWGTIAQSDTYVASSQNNDDRRREVPLVSEFDTHEEQDGVLQMTTEDMPAPEETPSEEVSRPRHARLAEELPTIEGGDEPTVIAEGGAVAPAPVVEPLVAPVAEDADAGKRHRPSKAVTTLIGLLVLALGAYLAGVVAFMNVFMPDTTLNGVDVSLKSASQVSEQSSDASERFPLTVTGDGIELSVDASQIKARYDNKAAVRTAIHSQHAWSWPLRILSHHDLTVEKKLSYDTMLLTDLVGSAVDAVNKDAKDPQDAKVAYDDEAGLYKVEEEKLGTKLDKPVVQETVRAALEAGESSVELGDDVLLKPQVTSSDESLKKAVDDVNASLKATQQLVTGDKTVATVDSEDLHKWVKLDDDLKVVFDDEACTTWARGELSEKLDTVGTKRSFSLPDGRELTVSGGTYGWSIDGASIAKEISENVKAGKEASIEIPWLITAEKYNPGGADWGDTLIEIDLGAQHVRYFQAGKVTWESDCVSGGMVNGKMHDTPTGIYYINSNIQSGNVELRGEIDPKTNKPEYISHVKYWMPFIGNSHALHDADWRSSFGGEIYKSAGSHGCVNLPPSKAAELYGMVSVGTVVIVHN